LISNNSNPHNLNYWIPNRIYQLTEYNIYYQISSISNPPSVDYTLCNIYYFINRLMFAILTMKLQTTKLQGEINRCSTMDETQITETTIPIEVRLLLRHDIRFQAIMIMLLVTKSNRHARIPWHSHVAKAFLVHLFT